MIYNKIIILRYLSANIIINVYFLQSNYLIYMNVCAIRIVRYAAFEFHGPPTNPCFVSLRQAIQLLKAVVTFDRTK